MAAQPLDGDAGRTVARSARALGSELSLFVRLADPDDAAARQTVDGAWSEVRAEFDAVDRALSRFRDDSELTALNRQAGTGRVVPASWRLREALAAMHRATRLTDGRFDPTVLVHLERLGERGAAPGPPVPAALAFSAALERPRPVHVPDLPVDTGGIGKGLALRWAAGRAAAGLPIGAGLLVDCGGDIVAAGEAPVGGWRVGIEDPAGRAYPAGRAGAGSEPVAVVALAAGAVATSSVRVRRWTSPDGEPVHHLIDPRTGTSARTGLVAVTVAGPDPAWSEVWSKALFLAGRAAIGDEARRRGLAAWWVDADGRLGMTPAARERSAWVAEWRLGG